MQTEFDIYDVKQDLTSLIDYLMPGNKKYLSLMTVLPGIILEDLVR